VAQVGTRGNACFMPIGSVPLIKPFFSVPSRAGFGFDYSFGRFRARVMQAARVAKSP